MLHQTGIDHGIATTRSGGFSRKLLKACLLVLPCIPLPALAQVAAPSADSASSDASASPFGDIVVTAQKRQQSTQDIGISISAFGGDQLEALGVAELEDIAGLVPGFTVAQSFRGPPIYTLRGVGFNSPNISSSSPVGVYQDEVSYPYPAMTQGPSFDIERIEVLKGPQGTLYGRNTTGGLINQITRKPRYDQDGYVQISGGSYDSYGIEGAIGGGLTDTLAARVAYYGQRSDRGWQQSVTHGGRLGLVDKAAARFSLAWEPSASARFLFTADWWRDKSDTQAAQAIEVYPEALISNGVPQAAWATVAPSLGINPAILGQAYQPTNASQANWVVNQLPWGGTVGGHNFTPAPLDFRKNNNMLALALRGDINMAEGIDLTSLSSYAKFNRDEVRDVAGWDIENAIGQGLGGIETFSQELRLSGQAGKINWIAGLFYSHDELEDRDKSWGGTITTLGPLRVFGSQAAAAAGASLAAQEDILWGFRDWQNQTNQTVTSKAMFGQIEYRASQAFNVTLGLRYTSDKAVFAGCSRDQGDNSIAATWNGFFNYFAHIPSNVAPGGCVTYLADLQPSVLSGGAIPFPAQGLVHKTLAEDNLSGRLGLDWHVNDDVLLYTSVARGFKSGAFPNLDANVSVQYEPARQEEVRAFEAGWKTRPIQGLTLNGAVFYYDYRNKQVFGGVSDIIFNQLNRIVNVPKSHVYGAELEVVANPLEGLSLQLTGTFLRAKIDEYVGYDEFGAVTNFVGATFNYTPKVQMNSVISYSHDIGENLSGRLTLSGRYSSSQKGDLVGDPRFAIRDYAVMDANFQLTTQDEKYTVTIWAKNLTDTYYWNSTQFQTDSIARYAAMPRTWGASLQVNF